MNLALGAGSLFFADVQPALSKRAQLLERMLQFCFDPHV